MQCPAPVIELARHINDVPIGELVQVLADDPAAVTDIPAWCRIKGHTYLDTSPQSGTFEVRRVY
jgi:tRNA 2-thiouridine synthesizing protein A